ncbi:phytase [Saccharopolyspora mangrovi]|uniref:Phytase n=1 Tax=Saccharopolyspora mangrovi TaxID=3082379 RepID=A0ABU6A4S1_9PSEU|nr:phytase [Saccharopolyspora sp. S2-29]MEB3366405.1 phytase [Saccharopolyspora sp. S2-29]
MTPSHTPGLLLSAKLAPVAAGVLALVMTGLPSASADDEGGLGHVQASFETPSYFGDDADGNADADDPAIWRHPTAQADSIVVGTLKEGGLTVFDLHGRELQRIAAPAAPAPGTKPGRFINVDILQGVRIGNQVTDIAVTTDRGRDRLRIYSIDPRGARAGAQVLADITTEAAPLLFSGSEAEVDQQHTGYGMTLWADPAGGAPWVAVSRRSETTVGLFRLSTDSAGKITYDRVATSDLPSSFDVGGTQWSPCEEPDERPQVEGMVVDRATNVLYAGQEDVGIWRIPLQQTGFGDPELVERVREYGQPAEYDPATEECIATGPASPEAGQHISADVEGLTIAYDGSRRTLVASSQGDDTFARYAITSGTPRYEAAAAIVDSAAIDGVQESDGAAVVNEPFGPDFPNGLLVVQDGANTPETPGGDGEPRDDTNFKLLRWDRFADAGSSDG